MPSMYVNVPKLPQETKDTLVAKLYEAAAPVLKAPHIYTFVNEYETLYENGKPAPQQMVVANLEAGPTKEEKVNALAEGMRAAVREVLGEDKDLTLVFHDNALDRLAIGGGDHCHQDEEVTTPAWPEWGGLPFRRVVPVGPAQVSTCEVGSRPVPGGDPGFL